MWRRWRRRWWVHCQWTAELSREAKLRKPFLALNYVKILAFAMTVAFVGVASKVFGNGASCYRQLFVRPPDVPFTTFFMRHSLHESFSRNVVVFQIGSDRNVEASVSLSVVVN